MNLEASTYHPSPLPLALPVSFTFYQGEREICRKKEKLLVSEWAEKNIIITDGPMRGPWRNDVTPYTIGPQNAWNLSYIRKIFLCWAPQTAKTRIAFNCMAYAIEHESRSAMYVGPDEKVTKRISKRRILPMFKQSPCLASIMSPWKDDTTATSIKFINGADLMMVWATSAAELSSESVPVLIKDERDKFPEFSGKEADPGSLGEIRTTAFPHTSKILELSTPNLETGIVADIEAEADIVYHYEAQCPICSAFQQMEFDHITWPKDKRDPREIFRNKLAHYQCKACGMHWDDYVRNKAVTNGLKNPASLYGWVPDNDIARPNVIAFHLPSWYSPFVSLSRVAAAFLRGQEDPKKLMVFVTQHKAEAWRETIIPKKESGILEHKTDIPPGIVPSWAIALTSFIDVQKHGFWFIVRAWAANLDNHLVQYGYMTTFTDVETLIYDTKYPITGSDKTMGIWRAGIDTGGGETESSEWTRTEEIYEWLRKQNERQMLLNRPFVVFGTKGASHTRTLDLKRIKISRIDTFTKSNKPIPGGLEIRLLDTSQYKALIHWRLERKLGESQRFFLHSETGEDYAKQLLAEELCKDRRGKQYWKRIRTANHYLDCEVGAAACADREWLPSLQMLAEYLKQETVKEQKASETKPQVARSKWMTQG
jgi:phage terminase large subunit GpA-like protein